MKFLQALLRAMITNRENQAKAYLRGHLYHH